MGENLLTRRENEARRALADAVAITQAAHGMVLVGGRIDDVGRMLTAANRKLHDASRALGVPIQ